MGEVNNINVKKWGIGTLSLIISIFSVMLSFTYIGGKNIWESVLNAMGVTFQIAIISIKVILIFFEIRS